MSKSKGNAVDPFDALEKHGADAIRWYFYINSAPWLPNRFHDGAVTEGQRKFMDTLWNTYAFWVLYAEIDQFDATKYTLDYDKLPVMDRWLLSRLNTVVGEVDADLNDYKIPEAARALDQFVDEMSNWYVRRGRERFWASGMEQDKINAYMTLYTALVTIAKTAAPMVPFMAEQIYQNLVVSIDPSAKESIHLCDFPAVKQEWIDKDLEAAMDAVLKVKTIGLAARNAANIKSRQPIGKMYVKAPFTMEANFADVVKDELNVKDIIFTDDVREFTSYTFKPQLKTVGPKYGKQLKGIQEYLASVDGNAAMDTLKSEGALKFDVNGTEVALAEEDLLISIAQKEGFEASADGDVTVVMDTNLSDELIEEGFVNELISKFQNMRKDSGFEVMDRINVYVSGNERIEAIMKKNEEAMATKLLADSVNYDKANASAAEYTINGEKVTLGVEKV